MGTTSLIVEYLGTDGMRQIHDLRLLSSEEEARIQAAFDILQDFNRGYNLLRFCRINFNNFRDYYNFVSTQKGGTLSETEQMLMELNRGLLNYLSGFRTFNDHQELLLKRISTDDANYLETFKKVTSTMFDGCFAYRFLWKLRNYVQHCGLPIGGIDIAEEDNNPEAVNTLIYFNRDGLLENYDGWAKLKSEIKSHPRKIEILPLVEELDFRIGEIGLHAASVHLSRIDSEWDMLNSYIEEAQDNFPNSAPSIGRVEVVDGGIIRLSNYSPFPIHIMQRMEDAAREIRRIQQEGEGHQL